MGNRATKPAPAVDAAPICSGSSGCVALDSVTPWPAAVTTEHNGCLHEESAYAMAMAWQRELQGRVQLRYSKRRKETIVRSYEYVHIHMIGGSGLSDLDDPIALVSAARAACMAWCALSRCRGYSAVENPAFWKRVFSDLQPTPLPRPPRPRRRDAPTSKPVPAITDAIRFFDQRPGSVFPRFELNFARGTFVRGEAKHRRAMDQLIACRAFCEGSPGTVMQDKRVAGVLLALQPFLLAERLSQSIPVTVLAPELEAKELRQLAAAVCTSIAAACTDDAGDSIRLPQFRIDVDDASDKVHLLDDVTEHTIDKAIGLHSGKRVDFDRDEGPESEFASMCSALPYSRLVEVVNLFSQRSHPMAGSRFRELTASEWAWLGYAIFHPENCKTNWTELHITMGVIDNAKAQAFIPMARGNNLLLGRESEASGCESNFYYLARVVKRTKMLSGRDRGASVLWILGGDDLTIDICVNSTDVSSFEEYVRAIVPGVGIGWIRSDSIREVFAVPPAMPQLRCLRLQMRGSAGDPASLAAIVSTMGANIEYLDTRACCQLDVSSLDWILRSTPRLRILRVRHDGSLWSFPSTSNNSSPLLRELELCTDGEYVAPSKDAIKYQLQHLRVLRITLDAWSGRQFPGRAAEVVSILRDHAHLQYLHWYDTNFCWMREDMNVPDPYCVGRTMTRDSLHELSEVEYSSALGPFTLQQRLAFLSVLGAVTGHSPALAAFDRDVISTILQFASNHVRRNLWIEDQRIQFNPAPL